MKKIFYIVLAAALSVVACTKITDDSKVDFDKTTAPEITTDVTHESDSVLVVTVKADESTTGYYAVAVFEGKIPVTAIDAEILLSGGYEGDAVFSEVCNAKDASVLEAVLEDLEPGYSYTVFAVAASKTCGVLTDVVSATATLGDKYAPEVIDNDFEVNEDGSLTMYALFDRDIELGEGKKLIIGFWGVNEEPGMVIQDYNIITEPVSYYIIGSDDEENLAVQDDVLCINVPSDKYTPGAYVSFSMEPGFVKSTAGYNFPGSDSPVFSDEGPLDDGLWAQFDNESFDVNLVYMNDEGEYVLAPEDTVFYFSDYETYDIALKAGFSVVNVSESLKATCVELSGRSTSFYQDVADSAVADSVMIYHLAEQPVYGATVNLDLEEGAYQDVFGNESNAVSIEGQLFFSYGYTREDILGVYDFDYLSDYSVPGAETEVVIEPVETSADSVWVSNLFKNVHMLDDLESFDNFNTTFKAKFDGDTGMLVCDCDAIGVGSYSNGWSGYVLAADLDTKEGNFGFLFTEKGAAVNTSGIYMYLNEWTAWDCISAGVGALTKTADLPE